MKKIKLVVLSLFLVGTSGFCVESGGDHHELHKNHVALFVGATHDHQDNDYFTVGLDYEYRLNDMLGIAALIDYADSNITVAGGGVFVHPWHDLRFLAAICNEHQSEHNELLIRLGVFYDFDFGKFSISPTVNVDLLESGDESIVYGVAVGMGF